MGKEVNIWLDDHRPLPNNYYVSVDTWIVVKNYDQFVEAVEKYKDNLELICFDHDLCDEHYAIFNKIIEETRVQQGSNTFKIIYPEVPYDTFKEKTGYHAAKYLVDNNIKVKSFSCQSFNHIGKANIEKLMNQYLNKQQ